MLNHESVQTGPGPNGLLPCPFCGSDNLKSGGDDKIVLVWCVACQATGPDQYSKTDWNTRAPTRDGTEGTGEADEFGYFELGRSFYEEFTRLFNGGNFKGFICGCSPIEILVHLINERDEATAAPPKPAPDAMWKLADKIRYLHNRGLLGYHGDYSITDDEYNQLVAALLSAPVPPADGATACKSCGEPIFQCPDCGKDISDPDEPHALDCSNRRLSTSPAVVAEPVAPINGNTLAQLQPSGNWTCPKCNAVYPATPPVRGDREAAIRTALKAHGYNDRQIDDPDFINEIFRRNIEITIDATLSLPSASVSESRS